MNTINTIPYHKVLEELRKNNNSSTKVNIYSLFNFNPMVLENYIKFFLNTKKINAKFLKSNYNQIDQEIFSTEFLKKAKKTRFIIIGSDINKKLFFNYKLINQYIENLKNNLEETLRKVSKLNNTSIIFFNSLSLISSNYLSKNDYYKINKKIDILNQFLVNSSITNEKLLILDVNKISSFIGIKNFYDDSNYNVSKIPFTEEANNYLSFEITKLINSELNVRKKCLIVDLDNTLWGGVLGEEGLHGIDLGKTFRGECYRNFQMYLKMLQKRGVILAICSKNNFSDVKECFKKNGEMFLNLNDFSSIQVNWKEKYLNANKIAQDLNIGKDSMVFFDDSEFEREQMRKFNPSINTVDFPKDPKDMIKTIENSLFFYQNKETSEDRKKKSQYEMMRKVNQAKVKASSLDQFLKSLSMKLDIYKINKLNFDRSVQLTNKTNQFNLTTKRYTSVKMQSYISSKDQISLIANLKDKYGDNGLTALVMCKKKNSTTWIIDNFLLSCRIFGRGVENILLFELLKKLKNKKVIQVEGSYIKSNKNSMCKNFYINNDFKKKNNSFLFEIKNLKNLKNHYIKIRHL